jgi:PD-(D/E)XK nuclease family transposase
MKFVDVTNDIAFRKIFGNENKTNSLISFLNAVLDLTGNNIIHIKFQNTVVAKQQL